MSKTLTFCLLFICFGCFGQADSIDAINIPGTHVFIKPPTGYKLSDNFTGLEKDDYSGICIMELSEGNYYTSTRNFSIEKFESLGVELISLKDSTIDGYDAKISEALDPMKTARSIQIVFGDSTFSTMIIGTIPVDDDIARQEMWRSILSSKHDKELQVDYLAAANFTVDDSQSQFKYAKSANSTSHIFSLNGIVKDSYENETMVMVSCMTSSPKLSPKSISLNFATGFRKEGYEVILEEDSFERINGYRAYEVVYKMVSPDGEETKMYLLVLMNSNQTISVLAKLYDNFQPLIEECRKLSRTIKIKG